MIQQQAVALQITNSSTTPTYTAAAVGAVITISAEVGTGTTPNGYVITPTWTSDLASTDVNMGSAVAGVAGGALLYTDLETAMEVT